LEEVILGYSTDPATVQILAELAMGKTVPHFTLQQAVLRIKGRL